MGAHPKWCIKKQKTEPDTEECLPLNVSLQNNWDFEEVCPTPDVLGQFDIMTARD